MSSSSTETPLLRCSGCKSALYCNQECQRAHWPAHRAQCIADSSSSTTSKIISNKKQCWWKIQRRHEETIPFRIAGEVQCVDHPTGPREFDALMAELEAPVLVKGVARDWAASRTWSPEYLSGVVGEVSAPVKVTTHGLFPDYTDNRQTFSTETNMPLREFAHRSLSLQNRASSPATPILSSSEYIYVYGIPLPEQLKLDCPIPGFLTQQRIGKCSLWWSSQGCCTPAHYDLPHVLLTQVSGIKTVWLFPPKHHDDLYPRATCYPALVNKERQSQVDIFHPDLKAFPNFSKAEGLRCILQPGDGLIIPSNWWHEVESNTHDCISVNYNFPEVADAILACSKFKQHTRFPILKLIDVYKDFAKTTGKSIPLDGIDPNQAAI
eukprot:CAMPEP_0114280434 /NCGR_PEP_ID=MMETSP0059-20121206/2435_1 /TAXON_ID=36894 /ORGANISM="Pyramimonas parkeae, Strain CCMP726" /LENGTH=379 /DNA_ID=CAMNT_0001400833 /DNA_START=82 /DNA_END=1221 /DNA_ORIENTATION=+